jgi:hypothetical protein
MSPDANEIKDQLHKKQQEALIASLQETRQILVNFPAHLQRSAQIKILSDVRDRIRPVVKASRIKENKEMLTKIYNKFDSLVSGLSSFDYSSEDVNRLKANAITRLREVIEVEAAGGKEIKISPVWKRYDPSKEDDEQEQQKDQKYHDKMDSEKKLERLLKDTPKLLERFAKGEKQLNILIAKRFIFARVPIIPLTKPPLVFDELKKYGFPVQKIGGYTVIEDQLVVGFNPKFLKDIAEDKKLRKKPADLAKMLADQLSLKNKKNYHILGPGNKHKTGLYFWMVPERSVNLMIKSTGAKLPHSKGGFSGAKKLETKQWGFAFSHDWAKQ